MNCELRSDGIHFDGYVNVTLKPSRVLNIHGQKMKETVEEHVFERALEKVDNVPLTLDHNSNRVLANTNDNTYKLYEDQIGLRATGIITDSEVIARAKELKGFSFGMRKVVDEIEERADKLPLRHIKDLVLDHVTVVLDKLPCYQSTLIECRAEDAAEEVIEERSCEDIKLIQQEENKQEYDNSPYRTRIEALKTTVNK